MNIHHGNTLDLNENVGRCESVTELREILNQNSAYYSEWKHYINRLMERRHVNYVQMARLCHSSKNTVKKWCREGAMLQNRHGFLKIALGFRLDLEETNELLQYYGKYPKLYAKSVEDSICIFLLTHKNEEADLYELYIQMRERLLKRLEQAEKCETAEDVDTIVIEDGIISQRTKEDFCQFVTAHQTEFQKSFQKLIEFIELFVKEKGKNMHHFSSVNKLDISYEKMMSQLKKRKEYPERMKLILLGVHLNMSMEYINKMLELAYMQPMCAKDNLECVVMYVVESAYLNNPSYTIESAMILQYYQRNPDIQERCRKILTDYWKSDKDYKASSSEDFAMDENISNYMKNVLEDLQWDEEGIYRYL